MVRSLCSQCRGHGFDPGLGRILHAAPYGQRKKASLLGTCHLGLCDLNSECTLGAFGEKGIGTFHITHPVTYIAILRAGTVMLFHSEMKQVRLSEATRMSRSLNWEDEEAGCAARQLVPYPRFLRSYES